MSKASPARIVSLVPSATETVFALGAGDQLVGRSHVCDFPEAARAQPVLTTPKLAAASSRGIHDEVRARLTAGLAIYDVDLEQLRALAPTHLLVQDQCSVCAVSPAELTGALTAWLGTPPELVSFAPHQLADVWRDLETIGAAIGRHAEARALRTQLAWRLSDLVEQSPHPAGEAPLRVACVEWLDPLMLAGHWVPELVRLAGGQPILARTGGPSLTVSAEILAAEKPDVLLLQICGFDLEASASAWDAAQPLRRDLSRRLGADVPVLLADGNAYFNRPGPRLVEAAARLASSLRCLEAERAARAAGPHRLGEASFARAKLG